MCLSKTEKSFTRDVNSVRNVTDVSEMRKICKKPSGIVYIYKYPILYKTIFVC